TKLALSSDFARGRNCCFLTSPKQEPAIMPNEQTKPRGEHYRRSPQANVIDSSPREVQVCWASHKRKHKHRTGDVKRAITLPVGMEGSVDEHRHALWRGCSRVGLNVDRNLTRLALSRDRNRFGRNLVTVEDFSDLRPLFANSAWAVTMFGPVVIKPERRVIGCAFNDPGDRKIADRSSNAIEQVLVGH